MVPRIAYTLIRYVILLVPTWNHSSGMIPPLCVLLVLCVGEYVLLLCISLQQSTISLLWVCCTLPLVYYVVKNATTWPRFRRTSTSYCFAGERVFFFFFSASPSSGQHLNIQQILQKLCLSLQSVRNIYHPLSNLSYDGKS